MRLLFFSLLFLFLVSCSSSEPPVQESAPVPSPADVPVVVNTTPRPSLVAPEVSVDIRSSETDRNNDDDPYAEEDNDEPLPASSADFLGMRVDPGYYYDQEFTTSQAVTQIVADAQTLNVTHLYVRAYSPVYGAFYPTTYPSTIVEGGYGQDDFLGQLIAAAHAEDIQVLAWLPVNNFLHVWQQHPTWREQTQTGDYLPGDDNSLLSPANEDFVSWYEGFLADLLSRYDLEGIDAAEGVIDVHWDFAPGYDAATFALLPPSAQAGDATWKQIRAQTLTDFHERICAVADAQGVLCSVTQTWDAQSDGDLQPAAVIAENSGFDFLGIASNDHAPDIFMAELLWQNEGQDVSWLTYAGDAFCDQMPASVTCIIHVEATTGDTATPTADEFFTSLDLADYVSDGVDFYDHYQLLDRDWI